MRKGAEDPRYEDNVVYLGQFKDTKYRLVEVSKGSRSTHKQRCTKRFRRDQPL